MSYPVMSTSVPWSLVKGGFHKTPSYSSLVQIPTSGRGRSAISLKPYPTWNFGVDLNMVQGGEWVQGSVLQTFLGLFMACCGRGGFFLFTDPNDNAVQSTTDGYTVTPSPGVLLNVTPSAAQPMGQTGDATSTIFQLARTIGAGVDILQQVSNVTVFVNGAPLTSPAGYSVSPLGVVSFTSAPPASAVLTWTGNFQYLCQFSEDTLKDLARVSKNSGGWLWSCGSIEFESMFV
jgi:hypothetical protein